MTIIYVFKLSLKAENKDKRQPNPKTSCLSNWPQLALFYGTKTNKVFRKTKFMLKIIAGSRLKIFTFIPNKLNSLMHE